MRIFTIDRVIQMNMEISLLAGHLVLLFPPSTTQNEVREESFVKYLQ